MCLSQVAFTVSETKHTAAMEKTIIKKIKIETESKTRRIIFRYHLLTIAAGVGFNHNSNWNL